MSFENSDLESTDFSGIVRLFPLPNLVLYPGVLQPLHIFEPRYRQLMRHALEGDGLITTALFQPNWEESLATEPPVCDVVTVGKVIAHAEQEDGRYNLMLKGVSRARIVREIPTELSYRMADVELLHEPKIMSTEMVDLRTRLLERYLELQNRCGVDDQAAMQLVEQDLPLGTLIDMIAFSADIGVLNQQAILETVHIPLRFKKLMDCLKNQLGEIRRTKELVCEFPPEFSFN